MNITAQVLITSLVIFGFAPKGHKWIDSTMVIEVKSKTGRIWMDRNLGANRVGIQEMGEAPSDYFYQWGRATDGHQLRTSSLIGMLSVSNMPKLILKDKFILALSPPNNWISSEDNTLWQGVNGLNNPCPCGFRVPTVDEWNAEKATWTLNNASGAYNSQLKLTMAGFRRSSTGMIIHVGTYGDYWSSTVSGSNALYLAFNESNAFINTSNRAYGGSIRCIKN